MRIYTLMMSLLIVALAAAGCSQPEPVRAEYEPADCEEVEEEQTEQAEQTEQQAADEEAEADRWQEPPADDDAVNVALEDVEEAEQAGEQAEEQAGDADGEAVEESSDEQAERAGAGVVNLNDASINQLMELPGVGPALAARIVEFRQQRRFEKPEHLVRVRGIGEATFAKLAPMVAVDGPTTLAK